MISRTTGVLSQHRMFVWMTRLGLVFPFLAGFQVAWSEEAWRAEADARIEKIRKGDFEVRVTDPDGKPLANAGVEISLVRHGFLFGTAVQGGMIVDPSSAGQAYRACVLKYFNVITADHDMKWAGIEPTNGVRDFGGGDAIARFAEENGLALRGHCVLWGEPQFMQPWLRDLPTAEVKKRALAHASEVAAHYAGKVRSWDVINELVTGDWYGQILPPSFKLDVFDAVHKADPKATLFLNEMQLLHNDQYLEKTIEIARWLKAEKIPLGGIGIQEHDGHEAALERPDPNAAAFRRLTPEVIWARLDRLATLGLPLELTETSAGAWDVNARGDALETLIRVSFAHPAVDAFILWGFQEGRIWKANAFLVNANGTLNAAGERVFGLWEKEWATKVTVKTDSEGVARFRGFYGTYQVAASKKAVATCDLTKESPNAQATLKPPASKGR